jgi:hypothetical protein
LSPINYTNETAISGINYAKPQSKPLSFILPWVNNIKLTNISISSLLPLNRVSEFGSMNSFDNKSLVVFQAWVLLKFVKKNLKTFNKKKLLGLYPTSQSYFLGNKNYFLSLDNVISFNNTLVRAQGGRNEYSQIICKAFLRGGLFPSIKSYNSKISKISNIRRLYYNVKKYSPAKNQSHASQLSNKKRFLYLLFRFYNKKIMQKIFDSPTKAIKRKEHYLVYNKERMKRFFKIFKKNINYLNSVSHIYSRLSYPNATNIYRPGINLINTSRLSSKYKTLFLFKSQTLPLIFFKKLHSLFTLFNREIALKINYFFNYHLLINKFINTEYTNLIPDSNSFR